MVIDNSLVWCMYLDKKFIVLEINGDLLIFFDKIIVNLNCSMIQMLFVLVFLYRKYIIKCVIVFIYQFIIGMGVKVVQQLENECVGIVGEMVYYYLIDKNCIFYCDLFMENGYIKEEMKLNNEIKKIFDFFICVIVMVVRVLVVGGYLEVVNVEFENDFDLLDV